MRVQSWWLAATLVLLISGTAWAHAEVTRSSPPDAALLAVAPSRISISFSEPIEAPADAIVVLAPDGSRVDRRDAAVSPTDVTMLTAGVDAPQAGTYTVRWSAVSADSHPIRGTRSFSVRAASAVAPAAAQAGNLPLYLQSTGRWLHLIGLSLLIGPLVLLVLTPVPLRNEVITRRLWRLSTIGAATALAAAAVLFTGQLAALRESFAEALTISSAAGLVGTRYGVLWLWRVAVAALLLVVTGTAATAADASPVAAGVRFSLLTAGVAALLLLTGLNGHSAATAPVPLSLTIDSIHLAATSVWLGGLMALSITLLPAARRAPADHAALLARLVPRFSLVALVSFELLIATGLYHAWAQVESPRALTATPYGRSLLIKLALVSAILIPAAFNLLLVRPRLATGRESGSALSTLVRRFNRLVLGEVVLGLAVLAIAALLTSMAPARTLNASAASPTTPAAEPDEGAVTLVENAGPTLVTLGVSPAQIGSNHLRVSLEPAPQSSAPASAPRLRIVPPEASGIAPWSVTPVREGDGFGATVSLAPAGEWTIEVRPESSERSSAAFAMKVPSSGAGDLLTLADTAMNQLRSVIEETTVAMPGATIRSHAQYQSPDRVHRQSDEGEEIVIGGTRYLHHGDLWHRDEAPAVHWPAYSIATSAQKVSMLRVEALNGAQCLVVAFVDATTGARNRVWLDLQTRRVLRRVAVSQGRTVTTDYLAFDRPVDIKPK